MGRLQSDLHSTEKTLHVRTERWEEWRNKTQETIRNIKSSNKERVESMKLNHSEEMAIETARLKSEQYRQDRAHTKELVAWQNKLETIQKSNE